MATFKTTDKNNKPVTVKTWSIKREEWENGAYLNCRCCGCAIRHVVTIDGANYGQSCGLRELGLEVKKTTKQSKVDAMLIQLQAAAEKAAYEVARDTRIALAKACGVHPNDTRTVGKLQQWATIAQAHELFF